MTDTSNDALLPCPNPWCISRTPPIPVKSTYAEDAWRVKCVCGVSCFRQDTEAEARAAWNTRQPDDRCPEAAARITELEDEIERLLSAIIKATDELESEGFVSAYVTLEEALRDTQP